MQGIFAADDESAGIFRRHDPLHRTRTAEAVVRTIEGVESPYAADGSSDLAIKIGGLERVCIDDKPSALGIRLRGKIDWRTRLGLHMQDEIVGQVCCKDQWR